MGFPGAGADCGPPLCSTCISGEMVCTSEPCPGTADAQEWTVWVLRDPRGCQPLQRSTLGGSVMPWGSWGRGVTWPGLTRTVLLPTPTLQWPVAGAPGPRGVSAAAAATWAFGGASGRALRPLLPSGDLPARAQTWRLNSVACGHVKVRTRSSEPSRKEPRTLQVPTPRTPREVQGLSLRDATKTWSPEGPERGSP